MEFGVHPPLLAFRRHAFSLAHLVDYAQTAEQFGFSSLCANDHLIASRPWLDSITALAAILTKPEPFPVQVPGVPIWIGSWGSEAGLRRVARLGDGWLASAFHVSPVSFADALARLHHSLQRAGREPQSFPHALGSMFFYLTEDRRVAEELLVEVVSPTLGRPVEHLRERLPIGTADQCAEKLRALQAAGVRKVFLWPVEDEASQLAKFHEQVLPQLR